MWTRAISGTIFLYQMFFLMYGFMKPMCSQDALEPYTFLHMITVTSEANPGQSVDVKHALLLTNRTEKYRQSYFS